MVARCEKLAVLLEASRLGREKKVEVLSEARLLRARCKRVGRGAELSSSGSADGWSSCDNLFIDDGRLRLGCGDEPEYGSCSFCWVVRDDEWFHRMERRRVGWSDKPDEGGADEAAWPMMKCHNRKGR